MKKFPVSQIVIFVVALVIVLCAAVVPDIMASRAAQPTGVVTATNESSTTQQDEATAKQEQQDQGSTSSTPTQLEIIPVDGDTSQSNTTESDLAPPAQDASPTHTTTDTTSTSANEADTWVDDSDDKTEPEAPAASATESGLTVRENGHYTSKEEVALYIHTYGHLPSNFISKTKAKKAGWVSSEGNLDEVCPGMSIGGSTYYNEGWDGEELLPEAKGRTWTECDINYHGGYRGAERIVFSNDGLIYYTDDHYQTFERLY